MCEGEENGPARGRTVINDQLPPNAACGKVNAEADRQIEGGFTDPVKCNLPLQIRICGDQHRNRRDDAEQAQKKCRSALKPFMQGFNSADGAAEVQNNQYDTSPNGVLCQPDGEGPADEQDNKKDDAEKREKAAAKEENHHKRVSISSISFPIAVKVL